MPCHHAMEKKKLVVSETETLEIVLKSLQKQKVSAALLVDEAGLYTGLFTLSSLFFNLLPVQVYVAGGDDLTLDAAPGVAKRLLKAKPLPVGQFCVRRTKTVYPQTPLWEGIQLLGQNQDLPLVVIDQGSGKPMGLMSRESVLAELERMQGE